MQRKLFTFVLLIATATVLSCSNSAENDNASKSDSTTVDHRSDNKYSASLREACEKFAKADHDNDSATYFSMLDSNFSITARGQTFASREDFRNHMKSFMARANPGTSIKTQNSYNIEDVKAGDHEPVWAGYERGTFENTARSEDGKYDRKVTGPYYRAWKLHNGEWKCYHVVFMAFSCEGNDCGPE